MADEKLIGYQDHVEWMGERILTLADVWPEQAHTAIVGLNPAPKSVAAGHYYQGLVGSRQMGRLADAGLFAPPDGSTFEAATLAAGIGLTDVVKRPTAREDAVTRAELTFGRAALEETLRVRGVSLVVCVFRHPVEVLLGGRSRPGFQHKTTASGAEVFRMPGPFERADDVEAVMSTLRKRIRS